MRDTILSILITLVLALWCLAGIRGVRRAKPDPEEYAPEMPFPGPVIASQAVGDRENGRVTHGKSFEEQRFEWAARMEAEELIREVGGC